MKTFCCSLLLTGCFILVGCANRDNHAQQHSTLKVKKTHQGAYPIKVVCTTGMVADLVRNIGGEHLRVDQLFAADVDPHLYKATDADTGKLGRAQVIFYSGLHLESKMTEIFDSLGRKIPSFGVADYLDHKTLLKDDEGAIDPHVWFDVKLWSNTAEIVRDALVLYDPKHADSYKANFAAHRSELELLDAYARRSFEEVPSSQRVLITSHDAFQYFGRAYGLEVKGIQGISTEAEASVAHITTLVNFLVERKVKAVFVETSVNPRNMEALIEGCAAKGHKVGRGGTLFSDAMGPEGTPTGTYVGMVRHNVDTIVSALK